ncbi:hypothetical protein F4805DRAFT_260147 [Annulohypoxylon moriforme]|nr:hypothetical protein F4805DRAFT_260147 [Annulohypoxylon moriforme]
MAEVMKMKKEYSDLPAWFHRIAGRREVYEGSVDIELEWYDEDISDIEEKPSKKEPSDEEPSDEEPSKAGPSDEELSKEGPPGEEPPKEEPLENNGRTRDTFELHWWCGEESDDESISERSYTGPADDLYYEMKEQREERKIELEELREKEQEIIQHHKDKVEEVHAVYKALEEKGGRGPPITLLEHNHRGINLKTAKFNLYSADYVENCDDDLGICWTFIMFSEGGSAVDIANGATSRAGRDSQKYASAQVYVNCDDDFEFSNLVIPDHASTKVYWSDFLRGKYRVGLQFVGQGYVRMTVGRDAIEATEGKPLPASCPDVFEFVGINPSGLKRKVEEEEDGQNKKARR